MRRQPENRSRLDTQIVAASVATVIVAAVIAGTSREAPESADQLERTVSQAEVRSNNLRQLGLDLATVAIADVQDARKGSWKQIPVSAAEVVESRHDYTNKRGIKTSIGFIVSDTSSSVGKGAAELIPEDVVSIGVYTMPQDDKAPIYGINVRLDDEKDAWTGNVDCGTARKGGGMGLDWDPTVDGPVSDAELLAVRAQALGVESDILDYAVDSVEEPAVC
jgi:hypothetical protein